MTPDEVGFKITPELHKEALDVDYGIDLGRKMAEIDEFGIHNSRGFRRQGPIEISQARHEGRPIGLVMADLDGLKAVNDEHGHPEGDKMINRARTAWRDIAEEFDVDIMVGRVGGDEFAALVFGDEEQTKLVAEEFERRYKTNGNENAEDFNKKTTTSIGYANISDEIRDFSSLMAAADKKLYEHKVAKLGELGRKDKLALLAARGIIKLFTKKRLRDAPKYWRKMGLLD